ncbi:type IV secretion system protein TraC [Serratia marcescens]|uniref:Type IV secretion system protein n=1 Tax=Serratia marcescens TaxID=615 RepID=A0A831EP21_SERMA|nr:type IV secretion system protein TraC [Serratia marcescens]RRU14446.1 type IV secretion system protein TraC [Serratia marcescens]RRU16495.1 type IV secretion system protein TraC [Serratia marcescens]RRU26399.1 type IV secretion system protein TraC [Serratia marcescens]RRU27915.1 type IV secretion system protein TraC [Serratia marcescens]RRU39784.1 type IV secretion system protein TraC [Serratia marcescens]
MNLLDKVTHTANSLLSALKMPDASSQANQLLGDMRFPQLSSLLPYRDYDESSGLFINDGSIGFMLEVQPLTGASPTEVLAIESLLRTKLPRGVPLSIHLMSSKRVGNHIESGLRDFSWSGRDADKFNAITRAYYLSAAEDRFSLPPGVDIPLTLRNYRVFISMCIKAKRNNKAAFVQMENLVKVLRASLMGAKMPTRTVDADDFINVVGEMINHDPDQLYDTPRTLDPYQDLNFQCIDNGFGMNVYPDCLKINLRSAGRESESVARVMNFQLEKNPDIAFLWASADNYGNLLYPELSIACPFIITLTMVVEEQEKNQFEANRKYLDLEKKSRTSYAKVFPNVVEEAKEWGDLRQRLSTNQTALASYFYNVTVFCEDNDNVALRCEQDVINTYRKNGIDLIAPRFKQHWNFLACLPFMAHHGVLDDLRKHGAVHRAETLNVVNLMPVVADNRLAPAGLLAPTYRNQLAFIDIYSEVMDNTNYNMAVCGTSGAGKTGLIQPMIRSVLDTGGVAWVFDMGDGYKSLCENMGGVYIDAQTLKFNPFANIVDIDESAERVRDQLSVMASPNEKLGDVAESLLLMAVKAAWIAKSTHARIDDVVDFLKESMDDSELSKTPEVRRDLHAMVILLDKYTQDGIYGDFFNSDEPTLRDDANMVVLELGSLKSRPNLLIAVMFSLIIYIEGRMYQSSRSAKKLCVIDEGWKLLDFKTEKVGDFIEEGYRTARRHYGAYITITQNIKDFESESASKAAKAAWANSSYKIILMQEAQAFKKYNQEYPDNFSQLEKDVIARFQSAKDQWFSSFMLMVAGRSSWHRLFVDPLSRAMYSSQGKDFEFIQSRREQGVSVHDAVYALAQRNFAEEMARLEQWVELQANRRMAA